MPAVKIKSPTLIGGISQQPPHLRYANQVEAAVNVVFDVATGATKRPGTELVAVPSSLDVDGDYAIFPMDWGDDHTYIAVIGFDGTDTTLRVFQSDGREATVNVTANAQTYLDANTPLGSDFRTATSSEQVTILNRKAVAAAAAGTPTATTMPIKLVRTTAPTSAAVAVFDADVNTWTARGGGNDTDNPGFSVIVSGDGLFTDIAYYRNRLVLSGNQYVDFSQAGAYFNFYLQNTASIVDDDSLEARLDSTINSIQTFKRALVAFGVNGQQYESNASDLLTPTTLAFDKTTRYETQQVKPIVLGSAMYFVGDKKDGSILYEYLYDDTQISNVAADTSRHVDKLLPDQIRGIDGSSANTTIFLIPNNTLPNADLLLEGGDRILLEGGDDILLDQVPVGSNKMYVYRWYWSGDNKQQSAWSIFEFGTGDRIADIAVLDNYCYMLTRLENPGSGEIGYIIERLPLGVARTADDGMPFTVHLDRCQKLIGSYSDPVTEWTIADDAIDPDTIVLGPSFGASAGNEVTLNTVLGLYVYGNGEHDAGEAYIGQAFQYTLTPTRLYRRDRNGVADILGELLINKVGVHHFESAHYDLTVSAPRRDDRTKTFEASAVGNGTTEAYYGGDADDITIKVESSSPKPTTVSAYEVEANYYPRA